VETLFKTAQKADGFRERMRVDLEAIRTLLSQNTNFSQQLQSVY
jgi:hypothetical protein